jgi:hypothetical protein
MAIEITTDLITFLVVILVPFGSAVAWLAVLHTKLKSSEEDIDKLQGEVRAMSIKLEVHIITANVLSKMGLGETKVE